MKKKSQIIILSLITILITVWLFNSISQIKADETSDGIDTSSVQEGSSGENIEARSMETNFDNVSEFSLASDGTGITTKNIAKSMSDIQSYGGNIEAIKQMILTDSGAKAYGLSGGSIVDVTNSIQITDLNGLDTVSSNTLQEFHITLTVAASASGIGSDLTSEVIVYIGNVSKVSTWSQLDTALMSNTVTIIDVQTSMTNTSTARADRALSDSRPNYVLLGNGNSLDFIGYSYRWGTNTSIVHKAVVDNVDLYGGHYFGPVTMWDRNAYGSSITYRNVNYTGSQVTASFQAVIRFEGKNVIKSKATRYTSYNGTVRNMADTNQSGLESHTLVFASNTDTTIEAENGDGVILGSWYSNYDTVATIQPSLTLEENATATIRTLGNDGETNYWQTDGGSIPSVISVQRNGKIDVGKNANLNVETADGTTRVPVRLGYQTATSQWTTSINLAESSNFNVNINGPIGNTMSRAGIMLQQNSVINVGDSAEMAINAKGMTTGAPVILMGQKAQLNVAKKGNLAINKDGGTGRLLDLSTGSQFKVSDLGVADFSSTNEGTSTSSMIYAGNGSSFIIGDKGTFISTIKDGTGSRNMLDFGTNTTFQFANAQKVDLDARGNTKVNLVNMTNPGTFKADVQAVSAWSKTDAAKVDPTFNWTPMYGINVNYNGTTTSKVAGNSITQAIQNDFVTNYKTANFSRVLYDYIPDVVMSLDQPSDNKKLESGQKLTGVVNNNAAIIFYKVVDENDASKDVLLTDTKVASPVEGDSRMFHTIADENGKFSYTLPGDVVLQAGEKIKAYAWLNGKDNYIIQTVSDKTPPSGESVTYEVGANDPVPDPSVFVKNPTDTNPSPQNFTYQFNAETPIEVIENEMKTVGEYVVKIDLSDEAGNTTVITSKLVVHPFNQVIFGDNFETTREEIKSMSDTELMNYILKNSNASSYKVSDGVKTNLTNFITVSDFGGLNDYDSLTPKDYSVELKVKASDSGLPTDITKKIVVTVIKSIGTVTAEFVNEKDESIVEPVSVDGIIGETIDLSTNDSIKSAIATVEQKNYDLDQRPADETAVLVTSEGTTVKYRFKGKLIIKSKPKDLDFGIKSVGNATTKVDKATYDTPLVIWDNRADLTSWTLTAQLEDSLRSQADTTKVLPDAIRYKVDSEATVPITMNDAQPITVHTHDAAGEYNISSAWDKGETGFQLEIPAGGVRKLGEYQTTILWQLGETP